VTRESSFLDAATREQEGQIDFSSSQLRLSSDGTVLAAAANNEDFQYVTDRKVKVFALPSGAEIQSIPYAYPGPLPQDIALSGSGQVLGKLVSTYSDRWAYRREATPVGGGAEPWSDTVAGGSGRTETEDVTLHLSPSGARIAASDGSDFRSGGTYLIENGSLVSAVQGGPLGWIDEDRLLLNRYIPRRFTVPVYTTSVIVSPTGQVLHSVVLPEIRSFQTVDTNSIYSPRRNQIISLADGRILWSSPNTSPSRDQGAVTGTHVVFAWGSTVRMEPY
jgi:hypothetical protein